MTDEAKVNMIVPPTGPVSPDEEERLGQLDAAVWAAMYEAGIKDRAEWITDDEVIRLRVSGRIVLEMPRREFRTTSDHEFLSRLKTAL